MGSSCCINTTLRTFARNKKLGQRAVLPPALDDAVPWAGCHDLLDG